MDLFNNELHLPVASILEHSGEERKEAGSPQREINRASWFSVGGLQTLGLGLCNVPEVTGIMEEHWVN